MAKNIFETIWTDRKSAVTEAYKLLQECYQSDANKNRATISAIQGKLSRTTARMDNLVAMRADGEIPRSNFKVYATKQKSKSLLRTKNLPN